LAQEERWLEGSDSASCALHPASGTFGTMDVDQVGDGTAAMDVDETNEAADKMFKDLLEKAKDLETTAPDEAQQAYKDIIFNKDIEDAAAKGREQAIYALCELLVKKKLPGEISILSKELRPLFEELPKAKTAKIVRMLIDQAAKTENSQELQIDMCKDCIEWCKGEKRTFLRQRVETRLAGLLMQANQFTTALSMLDVLLSEVKKLDDKLLLVEIHLIECRTHYALQHLPKCKAGLTSSKTNANAIHCPPLLQAEIDLWSGIVSAREKDYRTSFSYFYEAFEAFNASECELKAKTSMKYMLLSKIMQGRPKETANIIASKTGLKYTGPQIEAMAAVAGAHEARSLKKFEAVRAQYKAQIDEDPIIAYHLDDLNETLLEQNVNRILEPFSRIEISHVADLMELPMERTQAKLREMILDNKLNGTLDQGVGVLVVFDKEQVRSTYDNALKTIKNTSEVLDTLYGMAKQIA